MIMNMSNHRPMFGNLKNEFEAHL